MFAHGATQAEVARTFGVSAQAACVWYRRWHQGGEAALRGAGRAGRRPRLSQAELDAVAQALRSGPQAFGFAAGLWLRGFLRGAPATVVWDNLPSHHSRVMDAWLATQRHWLQVEYLPAYAHDLDPVEGLWATLKGVELANLCCDTIAEVLDAARAGIGRVRQERTLLVSFLRQCGLAP
jgi:transposase